MSVPPAQPVGAKLELTYACNLRCGFCYTDSPRHTLARTPELSDADWRLIVQELISIGVIEAVVTGGEPLLRRELALEVLEALDAAGVQASFNTNGWFVDEQIADRLARLGALRVFVSLDGVTPELHDRARGVPGSWRRAVSAIAALSDRGVRVNIVHVVTPENQHDAIEMVEHAWRLGAGGIRFTPVVPIGAAARGGSWKVDEDRLRSRVEEASRPFVGDLSVVVRPGFVPGGDARAPRALLVRPDGAVRTESVSPFRFGDALEDGLAASWARIVQEWDSPAVRAWQQPIRDGRRSLAGGDLVPYRDPEADPKAPESARAATGPVKLPAQVAALRDAGDGDVQAARALVKEIALGRRYRSAAARWTEGEQGARYVRVRGDTVTCLNPTAAVVMDACRQGPASDAVIMLAGRHPDVSRERLECDVIDAARRLLARGVLAPPHAPQGDGGAGAVRL